MENHPPVLQRSGAVGPRPRQIAVLPRQEGAVADGKVPAAQPLQPVVDVGEAAARRAHGAQAAVRRRKQPELYSFTKVFLL